MRFRRIILAPCSEKDAQRPRQKRLGVFVRINRENERTRTTIIASSAPFWCLEFSEFSEFREFKEFRAESAKQH